MNKIQYQRNVDVIDFKNYLNQSLSSFQHNYLNRKTNKTWNCTSLLSAFDNYNWKFKYTDPITKETISGNTFLQSKIALTSLSIGLRAAYEANNVQDIYNFSMAICKWGGVIHGNNRTLQQNINELFTLYLNSKSSMVGENVNDENTENVFNMNAGFTKIYSLLFDNLIIYDSRVGAALGWLVRKYCISKKLNSIPDSLLFSWAPSKEGENATNPKNRNPGVVNDQTFPNFSNRPNLQTKSMLRASWLIEMLVCENQNVPGNTISEKMRAIEAALFMIGYDLPNDTIDYQFNTRGSLKKRKLFNVLVTESGIIIQNNNNTTHKFSYEDIQRIIESLNNEFETNWFPLANNVKELHNGDEKAGLGKIIYELTGNTTKAQASSYLGAYLDEIGVLIFSKQTPFNSSRIVIGWKLNKEYIGENIQQIIEEYEND